MRRTANPPQNSRIDAAGHRLTCDNDHPLRYGYVRHDLEGVVTLPPKRRGLAAARKAAGHSQESLAERLGVERTTIQRWEAGETAPQPWHRPRLAEALGLPRDQLAELLDKTDALGESDDRLSYVLQHPGGVDLIAVAQVREQVHALDARYDRAPSTSLIAETGQCLGQVPSSAPTHPRPAFAKRCSPSKPKAPH
jgi:transcriptional regulator with XRE-family HTH domain